MTKVLRNDSEKLLMNCKIYLGEIINAPILILNNQRLQFIHVCPKIYSRLNSTDTSTEVTKPASVNCTNKLKCQLTAT